MMISFKLVKPKENLIVASPQRSFYDTAKYSDSEQHTYLGGFIAYQAWHFELADENMGRRTKLCKVCFRYAAISGKWILFVNGFLVAKNEIKVNYDKIEYAIPPDFEIKFTLVDTDFTLIVRHIKSSIKCQYYLNMDNNSKEPLKELRHDVTDCCSIGNMSSFSVSEKCTHRLMNGTVTTFYVINLKSPMGDDVVIERRYSEFAMLDVIIRSQTSKVLRATLPIISGKVYNPFTDQMSEEFIDQRRRALQQYLQDLIYNEKVFSYTELLLFLGLDPVTGSAMETRNDEPK